MRYIASVVLDHTTATYDKTYSYIVPEEWADQAQAGCRVKVLFGRGNQQKLGLILNIQKVETEPQGLKTIVELLDTTPILQKEGLFLLEYLCETTFCRYFDAFRLLVPTGLNYRFQYRYALGKAVTEELEERALDLLRYLARKKTPVRQELFYQECHLLGDDPTLSYLLKQSYIVQTQQVKQQVLDEKITMVRLLLVEKQPRFTPKQQTIVDFLEQEGAVSVKELLYYTGLSRAVLEALHKKGFVEYYEEIQARGSFIHAAPQTQPSKQLSPDQQKAYEAITSYAAEQPQKPVLLYGVTGAGKTQVFLKLIHNVVQKGQQVIVLIPEISLTSQTITTLQADFGNRVAVLHSGLSVGERADEWKRIQRGQAAIVVGTRSAVFAPVEHLGLIVMDEEQDSSYKSDKTPRFHARDIAIVRCRYHKAQFLLCSATPAVESSYYAAKGRYLTVSLKQRYGSAVLPEVFLVDMREDLLAQTLSISQTLREELHYNLERGEQSILLLNRRGYSTVVKCSSCSQPAECPQCSVTLTYHTANRRLVCHYCGYSQPIQEHCPHCGSEFIRYIGAGTQKLEEELHMCFPEAAVLRMDMDTTMTKQAHQRMFDAFAAGEYNILIGTQMVAKGLNFPNVTLVGVISADQSLFATDFRSYERSFALLTQVVGRSGRGSSKGRAFIQTYTPEHPIIAMAAAQDYPSFYKEEIASRKLHLYPPFCSIACIGFAGTVAAQVQGAAYGFAQNLAELAGTQFAHLPLRVLGPAEADIFKVAGKYRYKLLLKCKNNLETRELLRALLAIFYKEYKQISVFIDMHYDHF